MTESLFDKIENELVEKLEITNTPDIRVDSMDELKDKLEYQFYPESGFEFDRRDYFKYFFCDVICVDDDSFPELCMNFSNEDNTTEIHNFLSAIKRLFRIRFGITFTDVDEDKIENIYYMYYYLVLHPEELLKTYLLDYNFMEDGYNFRDIYTKKVLRSQKYESSGNEIYKAALDTNEKKLKPFISLDYREKNIAFIQYAEYIIDNDKFHFFDFFNKCYKIERNEIFKTLDEEINIFWNIKYESEYAIQKWFLNKVLNYDDRESDIGKLATDFYKQILDTEIELRSNK